MLGFPSSLCRLSQLRGLWLSRVALRSLPDQLGNLQHLSTFHLQSDDIETPPCNLSSAPDVSSISSSDCRSLRHFPQGMELLTRLETLGRLH